ncbi:hypothetical protein H9Q72_014003 [Fusarium xylarioides]|uniref:Uncharacterized protein n=1 Tax=Fusarium xylarioides TaxID=221167 RepID=A0A9P7IQW8_9HYPO|nr:hypothetical protein H9Q70_012250 [Fusarium xylarioides]KAG5757855.1 hypothetical protein H9Q72_014003 [Fusarium xylarioides]KAG5813576.1 hypothetical protein H9Q71_003701 [Fusarium xylarioides]KAG5824509.1 hypothetical protein H9Q74_005368 [Fusarium xylarioides]
MSERQIIVVEVAPSINQHSLEKKIDRADSKIEDLREKSNDKFEDVLYREKWASRRAVLSGFETLKQGEKTVLENEEQLLEMDLKSLELRKELREWEVYREELKASQEEMRFDEWMRREEGLAYEDWKKSTYSRE